MTLISIVLHLSRKSILVFTIFTGFLVWSIVTVKHHYCVEESSCMTSLGYARDSILKKTGLAFKDQAIHDEVCTKHCDKTIIIGHTNKEDISWVEKRLPGWHRAIYNVENPDASSPFRIPINKGNEAMLVYPAKEPHRSWVYLTYIIDNYNSLPSMMLFLHAHENGYRKAWHVDAPLHDQVHGIRNLNLDYVQQQGYVNLRCILRPGCDAGDGGADANLNVDEWNGIFKNSSTPPAWMALQSQSYQPLPKTGKLLDPRSSEFFAQELPPITITCCAQFGLTRDVVLQRPHSDYVAFREWLLETSASDARSGGAWEYLWHVVFGEMGQLCPDPDFCYCALYGKC